MPSDLNMGAPWDELSGLSQPAQGVPDFASMGGGVSGQPAQPPTPMDALRDFGSRAGVAQKASDVPKPPDKISMSTDPDGKRIVKVETSLDNYEATTRSAMNWHQALGGMQQQMERQDQMLKAREEQIRAQPAWVQLATALSANLAQQKDMPGWVQGLGKTAAQMNPQASQIEAQRMALLGPRAQLAEKLAGLDIHEQQITEQAAQRKATMALDAEKQRRLLVEKATDNAAQNIKAGTGDVDAGATLKSLVLAGATPDELKAAEATLGSLSKNVGKKFEVERSDKAEYQRLARENEARLTKMTAASISALAVKTSEKSDSAKALEETAQSIARGDLASIRNISSMRGGERMKLYARVMEINPKFSPAETDRKIAMEQSFTNGKDGQSLQSFDTFLQHAGEVTETLKGIEKTDVRLLNKSLNWWRKNMAGSPELARLETSLEPVGTEFMSFLLNQRALYVDDRKRIQTLLNADQPLKVSLATLEQMGKTAKDRFSAANQRYKRVMKQDIDHPFSEDAISGAAKIGITLPHGGTTAQSSTSNDPLEGRTATGPKGEKMVRRGGQWVPQ